MTEVFQPEVIRGLTILIYYSQIQKRIKQKINSIWIWVKSLSSYILFSLNSLYLSDINKHIFIV